MWLGTSIASIYARDAVTMKTGAMTLHELTGGRFVLGLGVSHPHLVTKLRGHEYERPSARCGSTWPRYRAAPWRGPRLTGTATDSEPPILIAALRERMLSLAATEADGAFPYLSPPIALPGCAEPWTPPRSRPDGSARGSRSRCRSFSRRDPDGRARRGSCLPGALPPHTELPGQLG